MCKPDENSGQFTYPDDPAYFCAMETAYLMLGGNMGDRAAYLRQGIALLGSSAGKVLRLSAVYESEPWGMSDPVWFLNQAVELQTALGVFDLLDALQDMEHSLGRTRVAGGYRARVIDMDIVLYGSSTVNTPRLTVPHPLMAQRMFVLQPLSELIPNMVHPVLKLTVGELTARCPDRLRVRLFAKNTRPER
ncbi:MAG: 2-amino-4-hydroxy-6-hydroxymethyldihydropteridine diphosphokinase [Bacteroidales bacterium]|jgi:2-amino-4-hydroxy-6-hydroxymethyldihydropteridine diphosphokinase|nr:2-amino-4-hydroxy-6-hydroxymethyldihydropteridine diphosphokinase [Bacteroidales bacterium]